MFPDVHVGGDDAVIIAVSYSSAPLMFVHAFGLFVACVLWRAQAYALYGESHRGLAPPRKAKSQQIQKQLRPTRISVNQHHLQIKHTLVAAAVLHCNIKSSAADRRMCDVWLCDDRMMLVSVLRALSKGRLSMAHCCGWVALGRRCQWPAQVRHHHGCVDQHLYLLDTTDVFPFLLRSLLPLLESFTRASVCRRCKTSLMV